MLIPLFTPRYSPVSEFSPWHLQFTLSLILHFVLKKSVTIAHRITFMRLYISRRGVNIRPLTYCYTVYESQKHSLNYSLAVFIETDHLALLKVRLWRSINERFPPDRDAYCPYVAPDLARPRMWKRIQNPANRACSGLRLLTRNTHSQISRDPIIFIIFIGS